ncbi:MAG: tetratricopeptide repeat protein [Terriglobales bacterium]
MARRSVILALWLVLGACCWAQSQVRVAAMRAAEGGHCAQALAGLASFSTAPAAVRRRAGVDYIRCAMLLGKPGRAARALPYLEREYPRDPEVLFLAVHVYSSMATAASRTLLRVAPGSYQVRELDAEALETQGKWRQAAAAYRQVLAADPNLPGIHFRLGRVLLSEPNPTPADVAAAKRQFEAELAVDPANAGAEYVLGNLAFIARQWPEAIRHLRRATEINPHFGEAFLLLGRARMAQDAYAAALAPLRQAARLEADNPTAHYYLALALYRTGHPKEAARQQKLQRAAILRAQAAKDRVQRALQGLPPAPAPVH